MTTKDGEKYGNVHRILLTFNNSINGATLLAVAAINALGHINIVSSCSSTAILALFGFNCDGLRWADGLAEFAGDTALFARGVTTQSMLSAESRRDGAFFKWIEDCVAG